MTSKAIRESLGIITSMKKRLIVSMHRAETRISEAEAELVDLKQTQSFLSTYEEQLRIWLMELEDKEGSNE